MLLAAILMLGAALAALAWIAAPGRRASQRVQRRIERVTRPAKPKQPDMQATAAPSVRREQARTLLGRFGRDLMRAWPRAPALRRRLDAAGIPVSPIDFLTLLALAGVSVGSAAYALMGASWIVAIGVGTLTATAAPHLFLSYRATARQQQFVSQLPDALDLIVRGVKSGLPVTEALQMAGQDLPNVVGALFREVTGQIQIGKGLHESLALVAERAQAQEFKFFVISLAIQQETGGNLAEILQNLATLIRRREQLKLKIRAMSSEARASAMIIGSLPFIMFGLIYLIDADYVMRLFTDQRGWALLGSGLTSLGLGLFIMRSMIRFEL